MPKRYRACYKHAEPNEDVPEHKGAPTDLRRAVLQAKYWAERSAGLDPLSVTILMTRMTANPSERVRVTAVNGAAWDQWIEEADDD